MSQQQGVEANVTLTADTSDYSSNINSAAASTDSLGKSVDSLTSKIDHLAKSAGKKLMGFAAVDVGGITAATAAYGAYEQQMVSLSAQAAILNRTMDGQKATFSSYSNSVNSLRATFGTTTRDAAQLVSTLSQMGDNTSSVDRLATTFTKLGNATQESSTDLAQSMLQLQRSMGTPQRDTEKYANQLAVLSANSNASAQSILQFSQQLAPVGRMVNMSQTDVMGISTAFQKAGQDGYQAANVFSKMMTDVAYASQSGSPDLAKYANLVGMTVGQFKNLGGTDQFLRIFDSINRQGPAAITTLNRMGLDGMRTVRTVTAMAQQSGGLQQAIDQANGADPKAMDRGSDATNTMVHELTKMRSELTMTGEAFGKNFAGPAKVFLDTMEKILSITRAVVSGPLGKLAALVAAVAAPFAAVAGTVLLASKALMVFAGANQLLRNSMTSGFREGKAGFAASPTQLRTTASGMQVPVAPMGKRGAELYRELPPNASARQRTGNWVQRGGYTGMARIGRRFMSEEESAGGPGMLSRGAGYAFLGAGKLAGGGARLFGMQYTGGTLRGLDNAAQRDRLFESPTFRGSVANGAGAVREAAAPVGNWFARMRDRLTTPATQYAREAAGEHYDNARERLANSRVGGYAQFVREGSQERLGPIATRMHEWSNTQVEALQNKMDPFAKMSERVAKLSGASAPDDLRKGAKANTELADSASRAARGMGEAEKATMSWTRGLRMGAGAAGRGLGAMGMGMLSTGAGAGVMAARGIGGLASSAYKGLFMENPWMLGITAGIAGMAAIHAGTKPLGQYGTPDNTGILNPYLQAGGLQPASTYTPLRRAQLDNKTVSQAMNISGTDAMAAKDSSYQLSNKQIKGKSQTEVLAMMAPQFSVMKSDPQSLTALSLDLTHQFGSTDAQSMMNRLARGDAANPMALASAGVHLKAGGSWFHKLMSGGAVSRTTASNKFSDLFSAYQDQANFIGSQPGDDSDLKATRFQGHAFGEALKNVGQQGGDRFNQVLSNNTKTGQPIVVADPNKTQRTAFTENLFKSSLGVNKISDSQAAKYRIDPHATSTNAAAEEFLRQVFSKTTPDALQNEVLSNFKLNKGLTNNAAVTAVMGAMKGNNLDSMGNSLGLDEKISFMAGGDQLGTKAARTAIAHPNDENAQFVAVDKAVDSFTKAGQSFATINQNMGGIKAAVGDPSDQRYILAQAVQQQAMRQESWKMPGMTRTQQFHTQMQDFASTFQGAIGDPQQQKIQHAAEDTLAQQVESQRQYFQGLLVQQREFNVQKHRSEVDFGVQRDRMDYQYNLSRTRANEDYNVERGRMEYQFNLSRDRAEADYAQQRKWSQEEYTRSRNREEFDFQLQRQRATADFNRQMTRSQYDYNLQRKRQEEDYQHSVVEMTKQTAEQAADIYKRTPVQSTTSASWLAFNAGEQLKQMQQQEANLKKLRGMGLSTDAIQQLKLTDPNNAQQLQRMVGDVQQDPKLIQQFNEAISKRLKAAGALTTDVSSEQWREFNRQYKLSRERGATDFERQVKLAKQDFTRNMNQQEKDFQRSLDRQAQDYQTGQQHSSTLFHQSMNRASQDFHTTEQNMSDDFHKSMNRAAKDYNTTTDNMVTDFNKSMNRAQKDLDRSATTIDGNFTQILTQATKKLSGHARTQAQTVLSEFSGVRDTTTGVSTDLMKALAAIFGVDYKPPHIAHATQTNQSAKNHQAIGDTRLAEGGVMPGFTPGQDVHHFVSPTGGTLHLSGGEAVMRPEWTKAVGGARAVAEMNAAAIKGQWFAKGGIVSRVPGAKQFAANEVGKPYIWGGVGPTGYDCSGFMSAITNFLRGQPIHQRVGATASFPWPGFLPGPGLFTIGSTNSYRGGVGHMAGTLDGLNVESRGGQGPIIGKNARGYKDPGFNKIYHLGASGDFGYGGTAGSVANPDIMAALQLLESSYPEVDKKVAQMSAVHPLVGNQMSKIINRVAWRAFEKLRNTHGDKHKDRFGGLKELKAALLKMGDTGVGGGPGGAPTNVHGNAAIVKQMAADKGWTGQEWDALYKVMMDESGFRNTAQNPTSTAYGMFQFLDKTWAAYGGKKTSDAKLQTKYGLRYIAQRYGDPLGALQHENQHGWYGDGQIFNGPQKVGVGERGPEMLLPLNDRGASFIQNLMEKMLPGNAAKSHHTAGFAQPTTVHNMHNYQVDKSTTFSGPITVQANDPNMLIAQLKARARASALTNAAKGGVKVA